MKLPSPKNTPRPLVSVICPTRQGALHLRRAIESVLGQDYKPIELIVIDGGSTDASIEILESYGERLRYITEPDTGQSDAINKGMALAHGEILAWLNSDDEYVPGAIAAAVEAFASTDAEMVYGDALAVDGWGRRYGHRMNVREGTARQLIHHRCFVIQPATFWRREVWETVGPLREDLHYALDYEFFMRVASQFSIAYWPYTFAIERLHSDAKTFNGNRNRIDEIREAAIANGADDLPTAFRPEGAGVYAVDAVRLLKAGKKEEARLAARQARVWAKPVGKFLLFFAAAGLAGGRGLPRLRLISNYLISRFRVAAVPSHNQPQMVRYSLSRDRAQKARELEQRGVQSSDLSRNPLRRLAGASRDKATRLAFGAYHRFKSEAVVHRIGPRLGVLKQHAPKPIDYKPPSPPERVTELPSITVVTPSFNQGKFIAATVDSVLDQHYPFLEYIVQDGESTDNTVDILRSYDHPDMSWESAPDTGQSNAINLGHRKGSGQVMAWLNSDDILMPGTLAYVGAFFSANPDVDVVYSHRVLIDAEGDEIGRWLLPGHDAKALMWADYIPQETMFWRRSIWDEVGGIDESFRFAMDWDLLLRFEVANANIVRLPIFGGGFRVYDEQLTSSVIESLGAEEMRRLRHRCHGRDVSSTEIAKALAPYLARHIALDRAWQAGILRY